MRSTFRSEKDANAQITQHRRPLRENENISVLLSRGRFVLVVRLPNLVQLAQNEVDFAAGMPHGV